MKKASPVDSETHFVDSCNALLIASPRPGPAGIFTRPGLGFRPRIDIIVTLFPQPDSPTIPRVLPRPTENETPSTALTMPSSVLK